VDHHHPCYHRRCCLVFHEKASERDGALSQLRVRTASLVEGCVRATGALEPARVTIESAQFAAPRLTSVLFRFNRCRLNKAPVKVARRVFLSVRVNQHVPCTLVGQPLSPLKGCNWRLTGAGHRPFLAFASDDKDHRYPHCFCTNSAITTCSITIQPKVWTKARGVCHYAQVQGGGRIIWPHDDNPRCATTEAQYFAEIVPVMPSCVADGSWKVTTGIIEEEGMNLQPRVSLYDGKMPAT
jgi:hypothetical protein